MTDKIDEQTIFLEDGVLQLKEEAHLLPHKGSLTGEECA